MENGKNNSATAITEEKKNQNNAPEEVSAEDFRLTGEEEKDGPWNPGSGVCNYR